MRKNSPPGSPGLKAALSTKRHPPASRSALIQRQQLLQTLEGTLSRKLALVHGPAGFGKTTLAAQWYRSLSTQGIAAVWLSLDASDNEPGRFLADLVEAIAEVEPDLGTGLAELVESNPGDSVDRILDQLIRELELLDQALVVFLDDWHLVEAPEIHRLLHQLLLRMPAMLHLVVASRSRGGIPVARLRVQDELVEINGADLRFGYEETRTFLAELKTLELSHEDLMSLWRSTEGWVAALQLASISLRRCADRERILQWASGAPNDVSEYLAENVLNGLPADLLDFLLKTSVLQRLNADLCAAVTGEPRSAQLLERLEQQELFLVPLDEERQWFRYHHLFARFLQRRLQRERPELPAALHRLAADWLAAQGQTAEALGHALAAGDVEQAIDLVEREAMTLVQHSYMATLRGLVSRLPRAPLTNRPGLQLAMAWAACLTHHPQEAEEALGQALASAAKSGSTATTLIGEARVIRACMAVYADRTEELEELVQPCLAAAASYPPWVVGVAANILAYRYLRTNQHARVAPLQLWAREYQDRAYGLFSGVYGRCFSGIAAARFGELALARAHFADAMALAQTSAGPQSNAARLAGALLGQLQYEANELTETERLLHDSRLLGAEGGVTDFYLATFIAGCRVLLLKGDPAAAAQLLREGATTAAQLHLGRLAAAIACEEIRLKLLLGEPQAAEQILADLERQCGVPGAVNPGVDSEVIEWLGLVRARVLCARGEAEGAVDLLRAQVQKMREAEHKYPEVLASILLSLALDMAGQEREAGDTLARAISEGVPRGIIRSFLDEGPRLISLLERLRERARRQPAGDGAMPDFGAAANLLLLASRDSPGGMTTPRAGGGLALLNGREIEILSLLDRGQANKEIARALGLSVETVKWYLKGIFCKLGVSRRAQATAEARRLQLLEGA